MGRKINGTSQHPLLKWVTNKPENGHFEHDVDESGDLFVISETGRLFAVLKQGSLPAANVMHDILNMQVPNN